MPADRLEYFVEGLFLWRARKTERPWYPTWRMPSFSLRNIIFPTCYFPRSVLTIPPATSIHGISLCVKEFLTDCKKNVKGPNLPRKPCFNMNTMLYLRMCVYVFACIDRNEWQENNPQSCSRRHHSVLFLSAVPLNILAEHRRKDRSAPSPGWQRSWIECARGN
jgi:hypothetical protein